MKKKISVTISDKILRDIDSLVDNIIIRNRSQSIEYLVKKSLQESKTAVILAGESKRLSEKKSKKRYALKIDHQTIIEKIIRKLADSGFRNIYIVSDHNTLTNIFKIIGDGSNYNADIEFVDEEVQEGTASALKRLKGKIKSTFLVVQCDLIIDKIDLTGLWQQHLQDKAICTLLISSSIIPQKNQTFGQISLDGQKVLSFIEKPISKSLTSTLFFWGIFLAEPELLSYNGKSLEYDVFPELAKRKLLGGKVSSIPHLHVHTPKDLANIKKLLRKLN
jgi:NDP-sugar pyrophosphorylase family protein